MKVMNSDRQPEVELPHMLRDATDRFLREDAAFVTLDEVRTLSAHLKKVTGSREYGEFDSALARRQSAC